MGYCTDYELEIKDLKGHSIESVDAAIVNMNGYFGNDGYDDEGGYFTWHDVNDTWFYHEEDMVKLSTQFPELLFTLRGAGENHEDLWRKYFKNGLIQRAPAQIIFAEFDETKLGPQNEGGD